MGSFRLGFGGSFGGEVVGLFLGERRNLHDRALGKCGAALRDVVVVPPQVNEITRLEGEDGIADRLGHFHVLHVVLDENHELVLFRVAIPAGFVVFVIFDDGEGGELARLAAAVGAEGRAAQALVVLQAGEAGRSVMRG